MNGLTTRNLDFNALFSAFTSRQLVKAYNILVLTYETVKRTKGEADAKDIYETYYASQNMKIVDLPSLRTALSNFIKERTGKVSMLAGTLQNKVYERQSTFMRHIPIDVIQEIESYVR